MAGSLNINQIIPDQGQDLYLNTGQYGSNLVVGNATTKLVNISPSGNVSVTGTLTSNNIVVNTSLTVNTSLKGPTPNVGDISANIATTQFVDTNATKPNITQITMNGMNALYILADGVMYATNGNVGWNYYTGRGPYNNAATFGMNGLSRVPIPSSSPIVKIGCGGQQFNYALLQDGSLYGWGYNNYGELGTGNTSVYNNPTLIATGVTNVFDDPSNGQYGQANRLFIQKNDGYIYGAGYNSNGAIGCNNTTGSVTTFSQILKTGGVSFNQNEIIGFWNLGADSGCAVAQTSDGRIWMTGYNGYGNFGLNNTTSYQVFTDTGTAWNNGDYSMRIKKIAGQCYSYGSTDTYNYVSLHLFMDNGTTTLYKSCGNNTWGQLGDGTSTQRQVPITPNVGSGRIKDIAGTGGAVGSIHVLKEDGTLYAHGYNAYGQLGDGTTSSRTSPTIVATNVAKLFHHGIAPYTYCYYSHAFIQLNNGQIQSCGYNGNGQLGVGDTTNRLSFTNVGLPTTGMKMMGYYTTSGTGNIVVMVSNNNTIYAWGYNGQYGVSGGASNNNACVPWNFTIPKAERNY